MHFGSPSDSLDPCGKAKPNYAHYIIRQGEAELCILELISVFYHCPSVGLKHLCALAPLGCTCFIKYFLVILKTIINNSSRLSILTCSHMQMRIKKTLFIKGVMAF